MKKRRALDVLEIRRELHAEPIEKRLQLVGCHRLFADEIEELS